MGIYRQWKSGDVHICKSGSLGLWGSWDKEGLQAWKSIRSSWCSYPWSLSLQGSRISWGMKGILIERVHQKERIESLSMKMNR